MNNEIILKILEESPAVAALLREEAAKTLQARHEAATTNERLQSEAEHVLPGLEAELSAAQGAHCEHDRRREPLLCGVVAARAELAQERLRLDQERDAAESILFGSYDPQIDEAIGFFRDRQDELRRRTINTNTRRDGTNPYTLEKSLTVWSNALALSASLAYCRTAIKELEALKLSPDFDAQRVEDLKAGVPDPTEMSEHIVYKLLPGVPDPRWTGKSDSQLSWEFNKLMEKCRTVLGR